MEDSRKSPWSICVRTTPRIKQQLRYIFYNNWKMWPTSVSREAEKSSWVEIPRHVWALEMSAWSRATSNWTSRCQPAKCVRWYGDYQSMAVVTNLKIETLYFKPNQATLLSKIGEMTLSRQLINYFLTYSSQGTKVIDNAKKTGGKEWQGDWMHQQSHPNGALSQ